MTGPLGGGGGAESAHLRQGDTLQPIEASNHFTQLTTAPMFQAPQLKPSGLRVRRDGCRAEGHLSDPGRWG